MLSHRPSSLLPCPHATALAQRNLQDPSRSHLLSHPSRLLLILRRGARVAPLPQAACPGSCARRRRFGTRGRRCPGPRPSARPPQPAARRGRPRVQLAAQWARVGGPVEMVAGRARHVAGRVCGVQSSRQHRGSRAGTAPIPPARAAGVAANPTRQQLRTSPRIHRGSSAWDGMVGRINDRKARVWVPREGPHGCSGTGTGLLCRAAQAA